MLTKQLAEPGSGWLDTDASGQDQGKLAPRFKQA